MKLIIGLIFALASIAGAQAQSAADSSAVTVAAPAADSAVAPAQAAGINPAQETVKFTSAQFISKADSAYTADNFVEAEHLYMQAMKVDGTSSELFYNLGNAYYRQGNLGKAILYYNRALKLDPSNGDARQNLEFVNSKITDKQIDSGSYMWSVWQGTVGMFRADTWAIIALALFALFLGAVAVYVFSSAVTVKKASFFGGMIVFVITVCAVIISFAAANRVNSDKEAIVLVPAARLATSPREARSQAEEAFLLHEGTKVEIIDSIANPGEGLWYEVLVGHGERAWIKADEVERI